MKAKKPCSAKKSNANKSKVAGVEPEITSSYPGLSGEDARSIDRVPALMAGIARWIKEAHAVCERNPETLNAHERCALWTFLAGVDLPGLFPTAFMVGHCIFLLRRDLEARGQTTLLQTMLMEVLGMPFEDAMVLEARFARPDPLARGIDLLGKYRPLA